MGDVLCFGNLQCDILCRPVTALPPPGALAQIEHIDLSLSGNGGNVAAVLGRLGVSVRLAGCRGSDVVGDGLAQLLSRLGVGVEHMSRSTVYATGISVIAVAPDGERSVLFVNGANAAFDLDRVPDSWLEQVPVVSVGSVFILPQFTGVQVGRLFSRARHFGAKTVLNIGWPTGTGDVEFLRPALEQSDYFILSFLEGRQLTGHSLAEEILDVVEPHTRGRVVLTLGADGCCFRDSGSIRHIPSEPVVATDTTGAGDSFIAGFIAGLDEGLALADCARLGCKVASFAVTGPGAYPRVPHRGELK